MSIAQTLALGALVRLRARVAHEVGEQPLDQPVLADDALGALAPGLREQRFFPRAALDEPFGFEPLEHLARRRPRDAEHLRNPRRQRRRSAGERTVLADRKSEEVDRLEVLVD